ncbi:MAG: primosomal protein N' [Dissulfurispiraceae bacterium]
MYVDVVFPFKLSPLTYKIPDKAVTDITGRIVNAPLLGRNRLGVAIEVIEEPSKPLVSLQGQYKDIRTIHGVHQRFANEQVLSLMKWLSDYYLTPMGIALKSMFFEENLLALRLSEARSIKLISNSLSTADKSLERREDKSLIPSNLFEKQLSIVCSSVTTPAYRSTLLHAPSITYEHDFVSEVFRRTRDALHGAIILVPEIDQVEKLACLLREVVGERLSVLHSKISKQKRIETIKKILEEKSDIVIGTRSSILVPLRKVSFIAVIGEHSSSYKGQEGLRYNARDVAVMRAFIQKSSVLLSSICPSTESIHNSAIGKYVSLPQLLYSKPTLSPRQPEELYTPRPNIKIVDIRKYRPKELALSKEVLKKITDLLSKRERVLFLANSKGYSLIKCEDCGYMMKCKRCQVPLVFYKTVRLMKCHYCGVEDAVPHLCERCGGVTIKPFGTGAERIKEKIKDSLNIEASLVNEKAARLLFRRFDTQDSDLTPFVVGTPYAIRKTSPASFGAAVFLNADFLLSRPNFRAYEQGYQDVLQLSQIVKPEGTIFLQTYNPENIILRFIKNYDFGRFYEYELSQRKSLHYPPFSKIILFNIYWKRQPEGFLLNLQNILRSPDLGDTEILGPVEIPSPLRSFERCMQILLKSRNRRSIHVAAERLLTQLQKIRALKLVVDVDPLKI